MQEADARVQQEPEAMLNYEQYYPTQLPLRQPGMEETEAEAHAQDDRPPDLSLRRVRRLSISPLCSKPHFHDCQERVRPCHASWQDLGEQSFSPAFQLRLHRHSSNWQGYTNSAVSVLECC